MNKGDKDGIESKHRSGTRSMGRRFILEQSVEALVYIAAFALDEGESIAFAADADPVEARVMAAVQKPLSINSFIAKSGPPAWKHLPSWYMVATEDQMIPPQAEQFMAKRMGATVRKVPASHAAMVSHPKEVAELITLAAESTMLRGEQSKQR